MHFLLKVLVVAVASGSLLAGYAGVSKPQSGADGQQLRPRLHTTNRVPRGFKHIPFVSPFPAPKATATEQQRGFMLFSRPITQPVYRRSHPLPSERLTALSSFATLGEYEPLTFSIYPLRAMKNFQVKVSDLKSTQGIIKQKDLDLRLVTYWKMRYPMYTSKSYRELPELLEKVTVNSFIKGDCQRYWLTVHVPNNAVPGLYKGTVIISAGTSEPAVKLPIAFRVLPYKLQKDPQKHFTAFYPPFSHMFRAYSGAVLDKAIDTDLSSMLKYGFDHFPVFYLHSRQGKSGQGELYIKPNDERLIKRAIQLGFKGRIILVGGSNYFYKRYCPDGKSTGGHGKMSKYPKPGSGYYAAITRAVKIFITKTGKRGWPKILFFPFDEPRAGNAEFSALTYAAFKAGGGKTMVTNDPSSSYAHFYRQAGGLDIWCSQAFAVPYEKNIADKQYQYWSYPNHNSGELKDRVIMQKGGRMTYGYGFWRSGYQALMPWAWRWFPGSGHLDQFNYFNSKKSSGTGNRLDENGNFIPAVNWECFREGYDDGRYLYTLQKIMVARANNKDPQCRKLIAEAQQLLNKLWQQIPPHKKYLKCDFINDDEFKTLRWHIAELTMQLLKYKGNDIVSAPSVLVDMKSTSATKGDAWLKQAIKNKTVDYYNMAHNNFSAWQPTKDQELKFHIKNSEMYLNLHIDHKIDGAHPKTNKAPIGWPYVRYNLQPDKINIKDYDLFYCKIKFSSNRDAVANDVTKLRFVFRRPRGQGETGPAFDLGGNENVWQLVQIPLQTSNMKNIIEILLLAYEGYYPDQTKIIFTVSEIGLIKFKQPIIRQLNAPNTLLDSTKQLNVSIAGYAIKKAVAEGYQCRAELIDRQGRTVSSVSQPLTKKLQLTLPLTKVGVGRYSLKVMLYDKDGKINITKSKKINIIKGYL